MILTTEEKKSVLIVEDDEIISELISEIISEIGYNTYITKSGHEAITWLRHNSPDLMVLDYSLPDMNAAILISLVSHEMEDIPPFIISTGMGDEFIAVDMMKRGARDYLVKNNQFLTNLPLIVQRVLREIEIENKLYSAQNELDESQTRLRTVLDAIPDIICFKDSEGKWLETNNNYLEFLQIPEFDYHDKTDLEIVKHSKILSYNIENNEIAEKLAWENGDPVRKREVLTISDSKSLIFDIIRIPMFHFDGTKKGLLIAGRDITEIVKANDERQKIERKMIDAQKHESLGILTGGIAHDFNNLLTVILGHTDLSLHFTASNSSVYNSLKEIEKSAKRAADLCQQMLAYSGKEKIFIQPVNINQIIENMSQMINLSVSNRVEIEYKMKADISLIDGDISKIQQIVLNLIVNASESILDKTGTILIETGKINCNQEIFQKSIFSYNHTPGIFNFVCIKDNGCGIHSDIIDNIFDPFFSTKFTGRGLGLPAVLGLVKSHNGFITLETEENKGTEVKVYFPESLNGQIQEELHTNEIEHFDIEGYVLLIDDEETILKTTKDLLQFIGFKVLTSNNCNEAMELINSHKKEILFVILDYQMPLCDGIEVYKKLIEFSPNLPIIITSGYDESNIKDLFSLKKDFFFMQKPYTLNYFSQKIKEFLVLIN